MDREGICCVICVNMAKSYLLLTNFSIQPAQTSFAAWLWQFSMDNPVENVKLLSIDLKLSIDF
jgi:hypothetical protein